MTRSLKPVEEACSLNSSGLCFVSLLSILGLEFEEFRFITSAHDECSGLPKLGSRNSREPSFQDRAHLVLFLLHKENRFSVLAMALRYISSSQVVKRMKSVVMSNYQ
jgi:hypothetical protein